MDAGILSIGEVIFVAVVNPSFGDIGIAETDGADGTGDVALTACLGARSVLA